MKLDEAERDLQLALYALACRELPDLSELGQVEDLVYLYRGSCRRPGSPGAPSQPSPTSLIGLASASAPTSPRHTRCVPRKGVPN
jgi:hypothetical protein